MERVDGSWINPEELCKVSGILDAEVLCEMNF
jgi:hypothetical protein